MTHRATVAWLALAWAAFIVYGSLVPLDFVPLDIAQAWARFQHVPFLKLGIESRADWVANGVLYAPLGLLLVRAARAFGGPGWAAAAVGVTASWALAVGVEFTQLWFPQRTVSLNDILAECLGSLLGALVAPALSPWLDRLTLGWRSGGARLLPRLLEGYAAVYVLLCFFPYDFLLSAAEVQGKLASDKWGWWLAGHDPGLFRVALQWAVEVALAVPLGAWSGWHPRGRPARVGRAATLGLLLGLVIEGGQFFVASGVSQGVSVLSRGLGMAVGAALWPRVRAAGWSGLRSALRPWAGGLALVYLPVLAAASGVFSRSWHGLPGAWVSWQSTHLLPFYYHYFTSEALALFSLGSVALMYAPVLALCWLRGLRLPVTAALTAGLALSVEAAKLFVDGLHADPTNVLVAVASNLGLGLLLDLAQRAVAPDAAATEASSVDAAAGVPPTGRWWWWLCLLPVAAHAATFPVQPLALLSLLALAAGAVWRWPVLALGLVPAALPVLDLAPWSGRYFIDEFDGLQAVCLVVAFSRLPPKAGAGTLRGQAAGLARTLAFAALGLSLGLSSLRALWPLPDLLTGPFDNAWNSYYSPWNALRIVKGALWAWGFAALWVRLPVPAARRADVFSRGVLVGLGLTLLCVAWERLTFASLFDFAADFRITGPFSAMHKGGAYIECYLVVAAAFAWARLLQPGRATGRVVAALLLAATVYAVMVTYSRNGYAALGVVLLVGGAAAWMRGRQQALARRWAWGAAGLLALLALLAVALPIANGPYARQRLSKSAQDLAVRQAHWADGLALRDDSALTTWLGMGLGRYPQAHYWRSAEAVHAASYSLQGEGPQRVLRLGQGATLYVEQLISRPELGALTFGMDVRASAGAAAPQVLLCEKWTLTSLGCAAAGPATITAVPGAAGWQHLEMVLDASRLLARPAPWRAPLKLALLTPPRGTVDVRRVQLSTALGDPLLVNGDFQQGLDRWFFATDVDPPWHLHSLPVSVLFDQGLLGALAWSAVVALALLGGARALWRGQVLVLAALPAVLGFMASGLLNTLIDAPRFLWLLLVLLWLAPQRQPLNPVGPPPIGTSAAP